MYSLIIKTFKWLTLVLLLTLAYDAGAQSGKVTILKKVLDGSKNQLAPDSSVTVQDSVYFDPVLQSRLDTPYQVKNVVTFLINEYSNLLLPGQFDATINLRLIYTKPDFTVDSTEVSLAVNYDTSKSYKARSSFVFANAHKVTVKILGIDMSAQTDILPALMVESQMDVYPNYRMSCTDDAVKSISSNNPPDMDETDEITITWPFAAGADEYDLEWAFIDSVALLSGRYGNPVLPELVFRNNASRVTVADNSYSIPLMFNTGGKLFFRVRAIWQKAGYSRQETDWSSDFEGGLGSYSYGGHQRHLNWQSKIYFSEEGKRKVVVSYYDGSLRSRQVVTKDNTTNTTIVGESFYDYQGRPVIAVLPAPTLNTVIKYSRNFNQALNSSEYDKGNYDTLATPGDFLTASAAPMSDASGANQYYSSNNPEVDNSINRFIPSAQGYAFTETSYTQDNTGRVSRQGGLGPDYRLGSNHETKYFYATPTQDELDALFGTEVGDERHYFKNMVKDANGQFSVAYLDMKGRTIATALAGRPDSADLMDLPSNIAFNMIDTLSRPGSNILKDHVMESRQTKLVPVEGTYHFKYSFVPPVLQKQDCDNNMICYTGLYDLQITVTDDAYNQKLGGQPFDTIVRNYVQGSILANCSPPEAIQVEFDMLLPEGSYEITKKLILNREGIDFYRDNVFMQGNLCTSLEQFIQQQRALFINMECEPTCESCIDSIGTWDEFRINYMTRAGLLADSASHRGEAYAAFLMAKSNCEVLCNTVTAAGDIRTMMLLDMTPPSGQYANIEETANVYSLFYQQNTTTQPPYKRDTVIYLNEFGQPDKAYDELSNTFVNVQNLRPEQFVEKFKPTWADALLKFHPEYCKLLEYERHGASHLWDIDFKATDTYAEAKQKGYLNPTNNPAYAFPGAPGNPDPLSLENSQRKNELEGSLVNFNQQGGAGMLSMWSVAMATVKCSGEDNGCIARYNTPATAFDENNICAGDLDMAWRNFREMYLNRKRGIVFALVSQVSCPGIAGISPADLMAIGKQPHFNDASTALAWNGLGYLNTADPATIGDNANTALLDSYAANCETYVDVWKEKLSACFAPATVDAIVQKLKQVCIEGSDVDHPYGASSIKPSSTYQYQSFQDVLIEYGIGNDFDCNPLMLTTPKPYGKAPAYTSGESYIKPDDCQCRNLDALQLEYSINKKPADTSLSAYVFRTRAVNIPQADFEILLNACADGSNSCTYFSHPVQIPPIIQCNIAPACVPCRVTDSLYNDFTNKFPGIIPSADETDSLQQKKNQLFVNYMNHHLGFSKQVWEYLAFRDSCIAYPADDSTVCVAAGIVATYDNNGGSDFIHDIIQAGVNPAALTGGPGGPSPLVSVDYDGYLMAGQTTGSGGGGDDAYLLRTDPDGNVLWAKTYGGAGYDDFNTVKRTSDGGYIAIGTTKSYGHAAGDAFIVKTDAFGTVEWSRAIGNATVAGEQGSDILQMANGGYAFAGKYDFRPSYSNWLVGTLTSEGALSWAISVGSNSSDDGVSLIENADTLLLGAITQGTSYYDAAVVKINRNTGTIINAQRYDIESRSNWAGRIVNTPGGYRISFLNTDNFGISHGMAGVLQINHAGGVTSCYTLSKPSSKDVTGAAMEFTLDGGTLMGVNTSSVPVSGTDIYLQKINADNSIAWSNWINLQGSEAFWRLVQNYDGSYAGVGAAGNDGLFIKVSPSGGMGCENIPIETTVNNVQVYPGSFYCTATSLVNISSDLSITGHNAYPVVIYPDCSSSDSCYILNRGPLLCGNAAPLFPQVTMEEINNCTDSAFFAVSTGTALFNAYRDSLKGAFEEDYINNCLQVATQEVFTLSYSTSEYHYTLYYYDQAGNLIKTVPPAGVMVDRSSSWLSAVKAARAAKLDKPQLHNMITQYRYNTLNQVIAQQTPDAGISKFWYDRLGRLAVSQNARQGLENTYSYTVYDALGRIQEVGEITSSIPMTDHISRKADVLNGWLGDAAESRTQITRTVYDIPYTPIEPYLVAANLRNRVSWTAVYGTAADITTGSHASATFYTYDIHGNVDTLLQDYKSYSLAIEDASNRFKKVVYSYGLISGNVNSIAFQPGQADAFYHRYFYDSENKLINAETSRDSIYWENDAFYQYYKHGPLARTVIGQQQVQGIDYAYTLQGWLKGVNSTSMSPEFDIGEDGGSGKLVARDAYGFALHYYGKRDYSPVKSGVKPFAEGEDAGVNFKPLYNGNIGAMSVQLPYLGEPLLYAYRYDVLNRLVGMQALRNLNTTSNTWMPITVPDFKEEINYDPNGNILTYNRNGNNTFAGGPLGMDSMTYAYLPGTNKLDAISDLISSANYGSDIDMQSAGNYQYDAIGNLIEDHSEGIDSIEWTVYGKIKRIKKSNGTIINYAYDASGNRISKNVNGRETWYVRDAGGNVLSIYTYGDSTVNNGDLSQIETHLYGSSRLGILTHATNVKNRILPEERNLPGLGKGINVNFTRDKKFFELTNHLGNVLVTVSDRKRPVSIDGNTVDHYEAYISSTQDYYPFGMMMPGRNGHRVQGGFATGNTIVNGFSVPEVLTLNGRENNQPGEYAAFKGINFAEGFESGSEDDAFVARIVDEMYDGGTEGGGSNGSTALSGYRYGFNGKENDNEIKGEGNQQDYGMRVYDPRLGRFLSVDPLKDDYPYYTPYQFAGNMPIQFVDLDGLEPGPPPSQAYAMNKGLVDDLMAGKRTPRVVNSAKAGAVITLTMVIALDAAFTKGWATRTLLLTQVGGLFEHNTAKGSEGKHLQTERFKNGIVDLAIGWSIGRIAGTVIGLGMAAKEEVKYLFRGTSAGYEGSSAVQKIGITPTSSDPAVATIFALNGKNFGEGILQIALPRNLQGVEYTSNVLSTLEKEIALGIKPAEFTARSSITMSADQARDILSGMGINLPAKVTTESISETIRSTPSMSSSQIDEFFKKATQLNK